MVIELKDIVKIFDAPDGKTPVTVLDNLSLQIEQGASIAVVGPSGSGKSTLLNIIGALDKPTSGSVLLSGENLAEISENQLARIRNTEIGFIFQLHHLLPQLTVLENVLIPTIPGKNNTVDAVTDRAKSLLTKVGLESHFDYFPAQLSGGERQRVAVVRALINSPKVIIADEPTGSLDQASAENLGQILIELNRAESATLIVATHSLDLAHKMGKVYTLQNGKLQESPV